MTPFWENFGLSLPIMTFRIQNHSFPKSVDVDYIFDAETSFFNTDNYRLCFVK